MDESVQRPRIRVAAVLVEAGEILLVRHAKGGRRYWLLPGGGVDFGESLAEALRREMREEVGLEIEVAELLLVNDSIPEDKHRHMVNLYFRVKRVAGEVCVGEDPRIDEAAFLALEEIAGLDFYPRVAGELLAVLRGEALETPRYIGNRWDA